MYGYLFLLSLSSLSTPLPGEITLTGLVLPVGGIKEKVMAAKRSDIHHIIIPEANRKDWEELADNLKQGITFHFARTYRDVHKIAFPDQQSPMTTIVVPEQLQHSRL